MNRASAVLGAAFPGEGPSWSDPEGLRAALWADGDGRAILEAVEAMAAEHADVVVGQRKTYTAFSRAVQFAAIRPVKGGAAVLGLRVEPEGARLLPRARESWSDRLAASVRLERPEDFDQEVRAAFARAYEAG